MSLKGNNNEEKIWNYLLDKFNNKYSVAGLMGNLKAESGLNPKNLQNSYEKSLGLNDDTYTLAVDNNTYTNFAKDKAGYGLAQWTYWSRKQNLYNFIKNNNNSNSIGDLECQLNFLLLELTTTYKSVYKNLIKAKSISEASNLILTQFEKPADQSASVQKKRIIYGEEIYNKYAGSASIQVTSSSTVVSTPAKYTNSSLVTYTNISPNKTSPRNHAIDTITIHCFVGQVTVKSGVDCFQPKSKQASCNYVVDKNGKVGLVVEEKDRSWCSSNAANDHRAITIEVASDTKEPYSITSEAMVSLIQLCADICKRNNIKKLIWSDNKNDRVNHINGTNMTCHRDFKNKSCPGNYIYSREGQIAEAVNNILNGCSAIGTTTENTTLPSTDKKENTSITNLNSSFKIKVIVNALNIRSGAGTSYKITGCITDKGIYTIVETKGNWGRLKSNKGWINISKAYVKKI